MRRDKLKKIMLLLFASPVWADPSAFYQAVEVEHASVSQDVRIRELVRKHKEMVAICKDQLTADRASLEAGDIVTFAKAYVQVSKDSANRLKELGPVTQVIRRELDLVAYAEAYPIDATEMLMNCPTGPAIVRTETKEEGGIVRHIISVGGEE